MYSCGCASSVAFHVVVVLEFATSACASSERGRPSSGYREGPSCRLISRLASCALRMSAPRCSRLGQTALFSGAANNHVSRLGPAVQAAPPLCTHPLAAALEKWIMFLLRKCTLAKRIVVLDSRLFSPARATKPYRWHYLFRWRSLERGLSSGSCLRQGRSVESGRSSSRLFTQQLFEDKLRDWHHLTFLQKVGLVLVRGLSQATLQPLGHSPGHVRPASAKMDS